MVMDSVISCKKTGINTGLFMVIFGIAMAHQEAHAIFGFDIDTALFNLSLKTAKHSLKLAFKMLAANPKMVALIFSIYFYKEILCIVKDVGGYMVGEFPKISFAAMLCVLLYASANFTSEDESYS